MSNIKIPQNNLIVQEIFGHLKFLYKKEANLTMDQIIDEYAFSLATNTILFKRNMHLLGLQGTDVVELQIKEWYNVIYKSLFNLLNYDQELCFQKIKLKYQSLMSYSNIIQLINQHYNDLYGQEGGNIL